MRLDQILNESFTIHDVDPDQLYQTFKTSYENETGAAWSKEKTLSRARNWTFYGDSKGFVACRVQRSGMKKLVAVAGEPRSIMRGLGELQAEGGPIWGAVSAPLAAAAKKRGMIVPHTIMGGPFFIKALIKTIPAEVFGGHNPVVTKDGGIQFAYEDIGTVTKYLIGNKEYFLSALRMPQIEEAIAKVPGLSSVIRLMGLSESYREAIGSQFTHDGTTYDLNLALAAADTLPVRDFRVSDLAWILDADQPDPARLDHADPDAPILVTTWDNRQTVIDGLHRLAKAVRDGQQTIRGKLLTQLQLGRPIAVMESRTIAEAVDAAPLYHFAPAWSLREIIEADTLGKAGESVSLTRDPRHPFKAGRDVVLILDQEALRQRYRLEPSFGDSREHSELVAPHDESEERATRPIAPLSQYLDAIIIPTRLMQEIEEVRPYLTGGGDHMALNIFQDAVRFMRYVEPNGISYRVRQAGDPLWALR